MKVTTALESIQEQWVTPLVENYNQQQIYRWVRKYLFGPSGSGHYTDWELLQLIDEAPNPCKVLYPTDLKDTFWPIYIYVAGFHFQLEE